MPKCDPYRKALLAEEDAWMRSHDPRPFKYRPKTRPAATQAVLRRSAAMARSMGLTPMARGERAPSEQVGCTVKALDYVQAKAPDMRPTGHLPSDS